MHRHALGRGEQALRCQATEWQHTMYVDYPISVLGAGLQPDKQTGSTIIHREKPKSQTQQRNRFRRQDGGILSHAGIRDELGEYGTFFILRRRHRRGRRIASNRRKICRASQTHRAEIAMPWLCCSLHRDRSYSYETYASLREHIFSSTLLLAR